MWIQKKEIMMPGRNNVFNLCFYLLFTYYFSYYFSLTYYHSSITKRESIILYMQCLNVLKTLIRIILTNVIL